MYLMETVSLDHISSKTFSQNHFWKFELSIQAPQPLSYLCTCGKVLGIGMLNGNLLPISQTKKKLTLFK